MEVILLENIGNLGGLGDKVDVKAGFGRNYLIPQGKAVPATESALARMRPFSTGILVRGPGPFPQNVPSLTVKIPS